MIQPAVQATLHSVRTVRRPHRFISTPLRKIPKALAIGWTLAAMKDKYGYPCTERKVKAVLLQA
jgi:hypothetical protein